MNVLTIYATPEQLLLYLNTQPYIHLETCIEQRLKTPARAQIVFKSFTNYYRLHLHRRLKHQTRQPRRAYPQRENDIPLQ